MPEFQDYLNTIARQYSQWWKYYTLMDAEGKQKQEFAPLFDFGLMAQTIAAKDQLEQDDRSSQEKVERLPVTEALQKYAIGHVLLVGRPGSGKSTALARLMLDLVKGTQIPVLVELRSYQSSILELIRSAFKRHDLSLTIAEIETLLDDRKLILLIDGVNELPSESARIDLSNFRRNHSKVPMIFTTRDLGLGGDLGIEKKLEMQPLTETQMKLFVHAYLPGKADAMLGQLRDRLREFGTTPLLLWMLCSLFARTETIPQNLGEVFRLFTRGYEQQVKQDVVLESDRRLWPELLKQLAAAMMHGDKPTEFRVAIAPAEICAVFAEYLKTENPLVPRQALDDLLRHHLIQRNGDLVEFRHQLIQEYYAAEWLLERVGTLDDETLECDYLNYLKWTEPLALMLALVDNEALAVRVIDRALAVDLMLGARLAGEVRWKMQKKTIELVKNVELPTHSKPPEWMKIELLGLTRSDYAVPLLNHIIFESNEYSELDSSAAWELRHMSSHLVVPILEKAFQEKGKFVKYRVIDALIEIKFDSAVSLALSEDDAEVRYHAMHKICKICTEDSVTGIVHLIALSKRNLKTLQPKPVKYHEETGLEDLTVEDTAFEFEENTISFGTHFIKNMQLDIVNSALLRCIDASEDDIKTIALGFLGESNNRGMQIQQDSIFVYEDNVLGEDTREIQISYHKSYLSNSNSIVRANAVFDIAFLENNISDELVAVIIEMLNDSNIQTSTYAVTTITRLAEKIPDQKCHLSVAIPKMIELFKNSDRLNRGFLAEALGILSSPEDQEVCQVLISAVKESNSIDFPYEIRAIGCLKCQEAVPIMLDKLNGKNSHIQASILEVLPGIKGSEKILPNLWKIIDTSLGNSVFTSIQRIQYNCKFYKYEIQEQAKPRKADRTSSEGGGGDLSLATIDRQLNTIDRRIQQMADQPKNDFSGATFSAPVNFGDKPRGDFVGTQNYYTTDSEIKSAIADLKTLITELQTKYPNVTTETEALEIIDVEFTEIIQNPSHKFNKLGKQILNPERHFQAAKATIVEVAKKKLDQSLIATAIVTYLDKFSETPDKGA